MCEWSCRDVASYVCMKIEWRKEEVELRLDSQSLIAQLVRALH